MPISYQVRWKGAKEFTAALRDLGKRGAESAIVPAVGRAAIRTQDAIRRHLDAMVYAQPPAASGYRRTRTLYRSAHASPPGVDHSGDEAAAHGGRDLAATAPAQAAAIEGSQIVSEIGSWIDYAEAVHGGVNQPSPRPFVDAAIDDAEAMLAQEVEAAILRAIEGRRG